MKNNYSNSMGFEYGLDNTQNDNNDETIQSKCQTFANELQKTYKSKPIYINDSTRLKDHVITIFDKNYEITCQKKVKDDWDKFQE